MMPTEPEYEWRVVRINHAGFQTYGDPWQTEEYARDEFDLAQTSRYGRSACRVELQRRPVCSWQVVDTRDAPEVPADA